MEALAELSWRVYPSAALMAAGIAALWLGSRMASRGLNPPKGCAADMQAFVKGFRIAVTGAALTGLGAAWNWNLTWLFALSLVFGGEEIFESTIHLSILRWKPKYGHPARTANSR